MINTKLISCKKGFTIVELLISTVVFSMVLLVCSSAIINIGRIYYRGVVLSKTQDSARALSFSIQEAIRYSSLNTGLTIDSDFFDLPGGGTYESVIICIGRSRIYYAKNIMRSEVNDNVVYVDMDSSAACLPTDVLNTAFYDSKTFLISAGMRVVDIAHNLDRLGMTSLDITVAYGDDRDFVDNNSAYGCRSIREGGQFCAVSRIGLNLGSRLY